MNKREIRINNLKAIINDNYDGYQLRFSKDIRYSNSWLYNRLCPGERAKLETKDVRNIEEDLGLEIGSLDQEDFVPPTNFKSTNKNSSMKDEVQDALVGLIASLNPDKELPANAVRNLSKLAKAISEM